MTVAAGLHESLSRNGRSSRAPELKPAEDDDNGLMGRLQLAMALCVGVSALTVGWASVATIAGAVITNGFVVVENNSKRVQSLQGGVVSEIRVRNGSRVAADDVLIALDDTSTRASLGIVTSQLNELAGRKARLTAERDTTSELVFPDAFLTSHIDAARVADGERRLFHARQTAQDGQKAQLRERLKQTQEEINGFNQQKTAKSREQEIILQEVARVSDMTKRNLMPITRLLSLQREEVRIEGELGTLVAQMARSGVQMSETNLQILAIDQIRFSEAQKDLREVEGRIAELSERKIAADDQLNRLTLRAPIAGTVHELAVHTVGGVVSPAEQLMLIVPSQAILNIEVRLPPNQIDQLSIGQPCRIRFSAFNAQTTPEITGTLSRISPDLVRDATTGASFFTVRVTPDPDIASKLGGRELLPGMPVEVFIETKPRTALSYLLKPFTDQAGRAFREN